MNLKNLNTAEWFSLSRIITFPVVILLVLLELRQATAWFYVVMFSTDFIDGFFAFFYNMEGKRRALLDSVGDILYLLAGLFGFYMFENEFFVQHIGWIVFVALLYVTQLAVSLFKYGKPSFFHTYLAKIATGFQVVFIGYMFFFEASALIFYLAVFFSFLEVVEEVIMVFNIKKWRANVKGIWDAVRKK